MNDYIKLVDFFKLCIDTFENKDQNFIPLSDYKRLLLKVFDSSIVLEIVTKEGITLTRKDIFKYTDSSQKTYFILNNRTIKNMHQFDLDILLSQWEKIGDIYDKNEQKYFDYLLNDK